MQASQALSHRLKAQSVDDSPPQLTSCSELCSRRRYRCKEEATFTYRVAEGLLHPDGFHATGWLRRRRQNCPSIGPCWLPNCLSAQIPSHIYTINTHQVLGITRRVWERLCLLLLSDAPDLKHSAQHASAYPIQTAQAGNFFLGGREEQASHPRITTYSPGCWYR